MENKKLYIGIVLILVGITGLALLFGGHRQPTGIIGRGDMMYWMRQNLEDLMPPGIEPSQLPERDSTGARLVQYYCAQCHALPSPSLHVAAEWPAVVTRMARRMRAMGHHRMMMRGRVAVPSQLELQTMTSYLQRYAQEPIDTQAYKDALDTPAGQAFSDVCARCHALPSPTQHQRDEWPVVVERMKQRMEAQGQRAPDDETFERIITFLQRHSENAANVR